MSGCPTLEKAPARTAHAGSRGLALALALHAPSSAAVFQVNYAPAPSLPGLVFSACHEHVVRGNFSR